MKTKINMYYITGLITLLFMFFSSQSHAGGIQLNGTRVIFNGGGKEASILVVNKDKTNSTLIQSWVENVSGEKSSDFIVLPPLFLLNAEEEASIRIKSLTSKMPQDREKLYWLNVKNIAPSDPNAKNKLTINFRHRIKLIYRPESISKNRNDALESYKKVKVLSTGDGIKMSNPTPYYINFNKISVNGKDVMNPGYLEPFGSKVFSGYKGSNVTWQAINDFGGVSDVYPEKNIGNIIK